MCTFRVTFPPTAKMGSYQVNATESNGETVKENALWHYNSARAHDGLPPIKIMPKGVKYEELYLS